MKAALLFALCVFVLALTFTANATLHYHSRFSGDGNRTTRDIDLKFQLLAGDGKTNILGSFTVPSVNMRDGAFTVDLDFGTNFSRGFQGSLVIFGKPTGATNEFKFLEERRVFVESNAILVDRLNTSAAELKLQLIGMCFVIFFSVRRFNTPPTNRVQTTAARYWTAACLYAAAATGAYFLLVFSPRALNLAHLNAEGIPPTINTLSTPLLAALLLTVFLPNVFGLSTIDAHIRNWFLRIAEIPSAARDLADLLFRSAFTIDTSDINSLKNSQAVVPQHYFESVESELKEVGLELDRGPLLPKTDGRSLWKRIVALRALIPDQEQGVGILADYRRSFPEEFNKLESEYGRLKTMTVLWLQVGQDNNPKITALNREFTRDAKRLLLGFCTLISCALMKTNMNNRTRNQKLKTMGFDVEIPEPEMSIHQYAAVALLVAGGLMTCVVFLPGTTSRQNFGDRLVLVAMVTVMYIASIGCALIPKRQWQIAKLDEHKGRPWAFYVLAALMATTAAFTIALLFFYVGHKGDLATMWTRCTIKYPYFFLGGMAALTTAFLADNSQLLKLRLPNGIWEVSGWKLRVCEGLVAAAVTIGGAWIIKMGLIQTHKDVSAVFGNAPGLGFIIAVTLLAFTVGATVPAWYRREDEKQRKKEQAISPAVQAVAQPSI